jgi:hypothetical protein
MVRPLSNYRNLQPIGTTYKVGPVYTQTTALPSGSGKKFPAEIGREADWEPAVGCKKVKYKKRERPLLEFPFLGDCG